MMNTRRAAFVLGVLVTALLVSLPGVVSAQTRAQLTGRAILPSNYLNDGPPAGVALGKGALINGVKIPFDSQPVGSITAILPGAYPGTWVALTSGQFGGQSSADFQLRIYVFELSFRRVGSGTGEVVQLDRQILADPNGYVSKPLVNGDSKTRYLTGADFSPRAMSRVGNSYWVAEEMTPALLRFDAYGKLLEPPIALDGGRLQGMGVTPNESALIIAQHNGGRGITFRAFNLTTRSFEALATTYNLDRDADQVGGMTMINNDEAMIIELDSGENRRAAFKKVFLINLRNGSSAKTPLADLLNVEDPNGIAVDPIFNNARDAFGLSNPFKYPYRSIAAIYPSAEQSIVIANNNLVPYGLGRSASTADGTEYIQVQLTQPISVDPAFLRPLR
ncbi:MAG: esterase-like activity of phytase family protein [Anaerolineales bacterium]|nr:esterase-like activity of phytase family protein [Anaerolineales bacterium]